MGLFSDALETRGSINSPEDLLKLSKSGTQTKAGVGIDKDSALSLPAVYNAIRVLSETAASLPLELFRRTGPREKERATDHPLYNLVKNEPNGNQTSTAWRESLFANLHGWGNGFSKISFFRGMPAKIEHVKAENTKVFEKAGTGNKAFKAGAGTGDSENFPRGRFLHVHLYSYDGLAGLSPIAKARQSLGLAKAGRDFQARFFKDDGTPGGAIETEQKLDQEAKDLVKKDWKNKFTGEEGWHEPAVLDMGMDWKEISIPQRDAQFIETQDFSVREIARMFNIQPHLIKDLDDATFSNIDTQSLEFVKFSLRPILVKFEQELNRKLIPEEEKGELFFEHQLQGLLRGDVEARSEFYRTGISNGFFTPNEVRSFENLNPIDGGDKLFLQNNMLAIAEEGTDPDDLSAEQDDAEDARDRAEMMKREGDKTIEVRNANQKSQIKQDFQPTFIDAAERIIRRETSDILDIARSTLPQDRQGFEDRLDEFLEDHTEFFREQFIPPSQTLVSQIIPILEDEAGQSLENFDEEEEIITTLDGSAEAHANEVRDRTLETIQTPEGRDEPIAAIEERFNDRRRERPEGVGKREASEVAGSVELAAFTFAGISRKIWVDAPDDSCPACRNLNGVVVEINARFAQAGEDITGEGWTPTSSVQRPPLHTGCTCSIQPG